MSEARKTGKKNRKYGRNSTWCESYRARGTRERNKLLKMARHIKQFPLDAQAQSRLKSIKQKSAWSAASL